MSKTIYNIFLCASLFVFCVVLFHIDLVNFPKIYSKLSLTFSLVLLLAGFLAQAYSWKKTLEYAKCRVTLRDSLISIGSTLFSKYIPGKLWVIVGRSAYISSINKGELSKLTIVSIHAQLITLWTGLIFGISGIIAQNAFNAWGGLGIIFFLILSLIIFTPFLHKTLLRVCYKFFNKQIDLSALTFNEIFLLVPWYAAYWSLWAIGFYFLIFSFLPAPVSGWIALGFPLASTMGIIAVVAPGGLGVREGVIVGYALLFGFPLHEASVIAVIARLWFLGGEIAIFLLALVLRYGGSMNNKETLLT